MKNHAVGIVIKDRWEETQKCLNSLFYTNQDKDSYDIYLIDNGSSPDSVKHLKDFIKSKMLPIKNAVFMPNMSVSKAWNLFLYLSQDYEFRTKVDNDIIFQETINLQAARMTRAATPSDNDPLSGAPRSRSIVKGAGKRPMQRQSFAAKHSKFLDHMTDFQKANNVDLIGLVPVNPNITFRSMFDEVHSVSSNGMPYMFGACMMMTKKVFDELGYFHEELPRKIDVEYSQRALRNGFLMGYHPYYGVVHIGAGNSTETRQDRDTKYAEAAKIEKENPIEKLSHSAWEKDGPPILKAAKKNKIINLK